MFKLKLISAITAGMMIALPAMAALEPLPDAGLTPDSPFYFVKAWTEQIQNFFTFGAENKANQFLHLAEVRLAEYKKMVELGKEDLSQKTLDKFNEHLNRALEKVSELKKEKKDVKDLEERVSEARMKHIEVLKENLEKVPEQARKGLERAIKNSEHELEVDEAEKDLEDESEEPEGDEVSFRILEGSSSGISGVAMLESENGKTKVKVRLVGASEGVVQPSHLHVGACPNVGAVKYPLNSIVNGKSETVLNVSMDMLKSELPLALNVHKSQSEAGVSVACGDLAL